MLSSLQFPNDAVAVPPNPIICNCVNVESGAIPEVLKTRGCQVPVVEGVDPPPYNSTDGDAGPVLIYALIPFGPVDVERV